MTQTPLANSFTLAFPKDSANPDAIPAPSSVTLTGSNMGAMANPKPTMYDDFSTYGTVDGSQIPKTGHSKWDNVGGVFGANYEINTGNALTGRDYCIKSQDRKSYLAIPIEEVGGQAVNPDIIRMEWYVQLNQSLSVPPQGTNGSTKFVRLFDTPSGDVSRVSYIPVSQGYETQATFMSPFPDKSYTADPNKWHRVIVLIDSTGAMTHKLYVNGKFLGVMTGFGHDSSSPNYTGNESWYIERLGFDTRWGNGDPEQNDDYDPDLRHYLADWSQYPSTEVVEFSNSPVWRDDIEQLRVTQVCDTRSDTIITIPLTFYGELNQSPGSIYAHITKADGTVIDYGVIN